MPGGVPVGGDGQMPTGGDGQIPGGRPPPTGITMQSVANA